MSLASFGVRKPVVVNLCMMAVLGAGVIFGLGLRREFFPEVRPNIVMVFAPYPGAAPEDVERSLVKKIEDRLADLTDVKEINSVVSEGGASVRVEFEPGVDVDAAVARVKREMDALQDLPERADRITVEALIPNFPVCILALYGDGDERDMKEAARRMREDLRSLPGMGNVTLSGIRRDEVTVAVRPGSALAHGLSLPQVASRIRAAMAEIPGGTVRSDTLNIAVRTLGARERAEEVRRIVVKGAEPDGDSGPGDPPAGGGGSVVRLADIAEVREGFVDADIRARLNGEPAVWLTIFKEGEQDIISMADVVKAYAKGRRGEPLELTIGERLAGFFSRGEGDVSPRLQAYRLGQSRPPPPGELVITTDLSRFVSGRLELLMRNAFWGGSLVFLTLVVLLSWRVAFWVAVGLIISVMGTFAAMYAAGITLNLLSMFGLIVVIGILVDDAIVVAENINVRHERGEPALEAAVKGTNQVGWPVVTTVLTTICAFIPLALIEGRLGDMLGFLPIVVGVALAASLVECLFILPSHVGHSLVRVDRRRGRLNGAGAGSNPFEAVKAESGPGRATWIERVEFRFDDARDRLFNHRIAPGYIRLIKVCARRRYLSLAAAVGVLIASIGVLAGGRLEFIFFEADDAETINATLVMPVGTPVAVTDEAVRRIEAAALALEGEVDSAFAIAGAMGDISGEGGDAVSSHLGQVILELTPVEQRDRISEQIIQDIRDRVGPIPGMRSLRIESMTGGPGGAAITLTVSGEDPDRIDPVVDRVKAMLEQFRGVRDVSDDAEGGQRELRITLRDGAGSMGFTTAQLAEQVQGAVFGIDAHTFAGDREDVDVRVMYTDDVRRSLAALERTYVFTPDGRAAPLAEAARLEEAEAYATIRRLDRRRAVTISADVDRGAGANPEEVMRSLRPRLMELEAANPGIRIVERGRQKDVREGMASLPLGMLVAAGLIYVTLAWLFSSYVQPLIVMAAIPFAAIGMIWGHVLMGYTLTFMSLIGFIALSGVVVNGSLILMEFYNQKRRAGWGVGPAAMLAGRARLRPIILTTLTTVLGLTPLMLEQSFQARFLIPMAITISFGLMSSTLVILVVIPCLLLIGEDIRIGATRLWRGR